MTTKSNPLKTAEHFKFLADEHAGLSIQIEELTTAESIDIDNIKKRRSEKIGTLRKLRDALKNRLKNFAEKHGSKLFGNDKNPDQDTGILETTRARIQVKKNPPSIEKIDKKADDEELITKAKKSGFGNVIITTESFSLEAMEKLTDAELERIGHKRVNDKKTVTFTPIAKADSKTKVTIQPANA